MWVCKVSHLPKIKENGALINEINADRENINQDVYTEIEIQLLVTLLSLSINLKCPYWRFIKSTDDTDCNPKIICTANESFIESTYIVKVDNVEIVELHNLLDAIKVWFCTFWVFNIEYPGEIKSLLLFIQNNILGIDDNLKKKDSKITTFLTKINRYCQ